MKLAVLGSPVTHSLSPVMHQAALDHLGIDGEYRALDVDRPGFTVAFEAIRTGQLHGANVTMPYKTLAFDSCDHRSEQAIRAGAVNTLIGQQAQVIGENTDISGVAAAWAAAALPDDAPVNLLGAGGAAAAALVALEDRDVWVYARRTERASAIVQRTGVTARVVAWGAAVRSGVLVNATSLGMNGENLPQELLQSAVGLLDMAYGDAETPAVAQMRAHGNPVAVGLDMLVGQAVGSFKIWTGLDIEPSVMRRAAENELERHLA